MTPTSPTDASLTDLLGKNRLSWNSAVPALSSHGRRSLEFLRGNGTTLDPEELRLLGDVRGSRVVHLLCHTGLNTLSLARLGATVIGVDVSDEAIARATRAAEETGIEAGFERAEVVDWLERAGAQGRRFDVAFASYGVMVWIVDLRRWARGVASTLDRGGRLVLLDFHPMAFCFDRDWRHRFDYSSGGEPVEWGIGVHDYVGAAAHKAGYVADGYEEGVTDFENPHPCTTFRWGLAEVITAVLEAGLRLDLVTEYPYSYRDPIAQDVRRDPDGKLYPVDGVPRVPLVYGLQATRP